MYLMISTYLRPLDEVDAIRGEHLEFVRALLADGVVVAAGRRVPVTGGILLLNVSSEDAARAVMAEDPYVQAGVAEYEPVGWAPNIGALADLTTAAD